HIYDTATARPVAVILRPGKTPSGKEVRGHLRRLVRRIRKHWPHTHLTIRGDGHYSRPEVMAWCEENGIDFVFGLPGNAILAGAVEEAADDIRTRVPSTRSPPCAASPRPATRPSPGSGSAAPAPASKRRQRGSTFASSLTLHSQRRDLRACFDESVTKVARDLRVSFQNRSSCHRRLAS